MICYLFLRDRKLSVEKSESVSPMDSSPSPTLPTLKITTPPRIPEKAQELTFPEPSPPEYIAPLPESPGQIPVTPPRKSPSPQPPQTSEKTEEAPGPAPVRRRRKTLDTEDQQQYAGQQSRPARRSKIEETIAEVGIYLSFVSVSVYIYIYMYPHLYLYLYLYICISVYLYICTSVYLYICLYVYL